MCEGDEDDDDVNARGLGIASVRTYMKVCFLWSFVDTYLMIMIHDDDAPRTKEPSVWLALLSGLLRCLLIGKK